MFVEEVQNFYEARFRAFDELDFAADNGEGNAQAISKLQRRASTLRKVKEATVDGLKPALAAAAASTSATNSHRHNNFVPQSFLELTNL